MASPIIELFDKACAVDPKKPWCIGEGRELGYGAMTDMVRRLTTHIEKSGWTRGDRVILCTGDDFALMCWAVSLLRNGVTAVVLNHNLQGDELRNLLGAAEPRAIVADEEILERVGDDPGLSGVDVVPVAADSRKYGYGKSGLFGKKKGGGDADKYPGMLESLEPAAELPADVPEDAVAIILFTSGTTSRPKGVELTHGNLFTQMNTFARQYRCSEDTRLLDILPLYHTDGLTAGVFLSFTVQGTVCRPLEFSVARVGDLLDTVYKLRATHFVTVPSMLRLICDLGKEYRKAFLTHDFQFVISSAAYLDPDLWTQFEERFGVRVVNAYGLTETVCVSTYCGPDDETRKLGTIGKPVDCEVRIVDDEGNEVPRGEKGELTIKGPHIMKGYFRMPEQTAEVLKDGWFHTGDLARIDEDGFISIVGRKKDMIISSGLNIYPEDVNNTLKRIAGVADAATFGVEDPVWGERVVAAIVPDAGLETLDTDKVSEEFLKMASLEKLPREIFVLKELPRSGSGKVVKAELVDITDRMRAEQSGIPQGEDLTERVLQAAARVFKVPQDQLRPDSGPDNTKGWNSLAHVEFLLALEKEFDFKMSPQEIMRITSIKDSLNIVEKKLAS